MASDDMERPTSEELDKFAKIAKAEDNFLRFVYGDPLAGPAAEEL